MEKVMEARKTSYNNKDMMRKELVEEMWQRTAADELSPPLQYELASSILQKAGRLVARAQLQRPSRGPILPM